MKAFLRRSYNKIKNRLRKLRKVNHQQVFSNVYSGKVWGDDKKSRFYSGTGSDEPYAIPYTEVITRFIQQHKIKSVVDLGCGDFRIGKKITEANDVQYTGADVVDDLISYNTKEFGSKRISFEHVNIVKDKLPEGQLCLIRQVLQHLSNSDIQKVLKKCRQFEYLIITEHQPIDPNAIPNIDQDAFEGIRLGLNSGVYLDKPPYNKKVEELLTVFPEAEKNSKIVTFRVFL